MPTNERPRNEGPVLRSWVFDLPWKMQSVLLSGLRGPDERRCPELKKLVRFIRAATQNDAGVTSEDSYLDVGEPISSKDLMREVEYLSVHYVTHLLYALQIVGWQGPAWAQQSSRLWYEEIVDHMHLNPETWDQLRGRLA